MSPSQAEFQRIIDCHVHVFDAARFPCAANAWYIHVGTEVGTAVNLTHVLDYHGVAKALIVGPNSGYGLDNSCLLDALKQGAGQYNGIAVVRNDASLGELQDLQAAGVVGVAMNVALLGVDFYRDTASLLQRVCELDMHTQVQVQNDELVALKLMLIDSGVKLLFDHCGRPNPKAGVGQAGFAALLSLDESGRASVKISGLTQCSTLPYPYLDTWPFVQALVDAYTPKNLMWASDCLFSRAQARIDYGPLMSFFTQLLPDPSVRQTVLWDKPHRLFGFDPL